MKTKTVNYVENANNKVSYITSLINQKGQDVELRVIDKEQISITSENLKEQRFKNVGKFNVILYRYFPLIIISLALFVNLDFSITSMSQKHPEPPILISFMTLVTGFIFATLLFMENKSKKALLFGAVVISAFIFFKMTYFIEFLLAMKIAASSLIYMYLVKDIIEGNYKNTYYAKSPILILVWFKAKEASFINIVGVAFVMQLVALILFAK